MVFKDSILRLLYMSRYTVLCAVIPIWTKKLENLILDEFKIKANLSTFPCERNY